MKKIVFLNIFVFSLIIILLFLFPYIFTDISHISPNTQEIDNNTVEIDTSISYQTANETHVVSSYNFFIPDAMNQVPDTTDTWTTRKISFNNTVYNFYSPGEISGKRIIKADGGYLDVIVIQGPKVYWHNPEDCFLFSDWTVTNRTVLMVPFEEGSGPEAVNRSLPINRITVSSGSQEYHLSYFYLFRNRNDFRNVSLMSIMSPASQDIGGSRYLTQEVLHALFGNRSPMDIPGSPGSLHETAITYGENNPPAIRDWLVIGPFSSRSTDYAEYPPSDWEYNWLGENTGRVLPAEGQEMAGTVWRVTNGTYGIVDLDPQGSGNNQSYAYAAEYILSPDTRTLLLNVVSDDGVRVWLNGNEIHRRIRVGMGDQEINGIRIPRGSSLEDTIPITLRKGWNVLVLELYQWKGSWKYYVQLRRTDNTLPGDLVYSVQRPSYSEPGGPKVFQVGYEDDSAAEFSAEWDVDSDYTVGEGFKEFKRAVTRDSPESSIRFRLTSADTDRPHYLTIGVKKIAESSNGYILVNLYMNNKFIGTYTYPEDWLTKRILIPSILFREGDNILTMEWIEGEPYIVWDYISLE